MITIDEITEFFCILDKFYQEFDRSTKPFLLGNEITAKIGLYNLYIRY